MLHYRWGKLSDARQSMRMPVPDPGGVRCLQLIRETVTCHLGVYFLDLRRNAFFAHIPRNLGLAQQLLADCPNRRINFLLVLLRLHPRAHRLAQLMKESLLIFENRRSALRPVARAYKLSPQFPRGVERSYPLLHVAIADKVIRSIHARITRKEDALLRKPREGVAMRVRHSQMHQFHAMFAIIEK